MALIETDVLVALISREDKHHVETVELLKRLKGVKLSPYSLIELELLISSGVIVVKRPEFYESLSRALAYFNVKQLPPRPEHFRRAWALRRSYNLSFFDSLHVATAIEDGEVLVSYDKRYKQVKELRYMRPTELLSR